MKFPRILVKAPNWIGDAVMASPLLAALRDQWPDGHLGVLARAKVRPVIERGPLVDEIVDEPEGNPWRIARALAPGTWDIAISCSSSVRVAAAFAIAKIPARFGFAGDGRHFFLTEPVPEPPRSLHQIEHYLLLGLAAGLEVPKSRNPVWRVLPADEAEADAFLKSAGHGRETLVGFAPGAAFGPAKRWYTSRWGELADRLLLEREARPVFVGGEAEVPAVLAITRLTARSCLNAAGRLSLGGTAALLRRTRAFVSNDSGLMHVGAAVGVPTVGLFGSTNPQWTGPRGPGNEAVWGNVPCSPCYRRTCVRGRDYGCLDAIAVDAVLGALAPALAGPGAGRGPAIASPHGRGTAVRPGRGR